MDTLKKLENGSQIQNLECEICGKKLKSENWLKRHIKNHDPDEKMKRSLRAIEIQNRPDVRDKKRNAALISQNKADVKKKRAESQKLTNLRQDVREKRSANMRKRMADPCVREKMSEMTKQQWADSKTREKMQEQLRLAALRPDVREKRRIASTKANAKQEVKEKHRQAALEIMSRSGMKERIACAVSKSWQDENIRNKKCESMIEAWARHDVREKHKLSFQLALNKQEVKQRMRDAAKNPLRFKKYHETMKRNGAYGKISKPELKLKLILEEKFGIDNVVYQVPVHRWPVDFYIKNIDTYVQLDGVYWHGLDRPLSEIEQCKTMRDKQILVKMRIDKEQNEWFKNNSLKLIRITDVQLNTDSFSLVKMLELI